MFNVHINIQYKISRFTKQIDEWARYTSTTSPLVSTLTRLQSHGHRHNIPERGGGRGDRRVYTPTTTDLLHLEEDEDVGVTG